MSIFVFGSNLAGRHGKGAALHARQNCGAIYGQGEGLQGQSYAIPTKDARLRTLPLGIIAVHINNFILFARSRPDLEFEVTRIGCGLAGATIEADTTIVAHDRDVRIGFGGRIHPQLHRTGVVGPRTDDAIGRAVGQV